MPKNITSSGSDYKFGADIPHTCRYLYIPIIRLLQRNNCMRVLDIGCGNGSLAKYLHENGMEVTGVEPSGSGIENARKKLPDAAFYCMGVYDPPEQIAENNFDAIVSTEVIEHLFYPRELLRFAAAKLKPGGTIILTTPYHGYLKNLILSITGKWDSHHTALWDGGHIKFWSKATLSRLLTEEGFEVTDFVGCGRIPCVWKSMLLSGKLKA
jgi:2-polyprenyl-3-methyl-5-hydroxy-6-metoxy-1,4-benzoquinol methylase